MRTKIIFYPRYVAEFQAATMHLTIEEEGFYNRVLDFLYMNDNKLPDDKWGKLLRIPAVRRSHLVLVLEEFCDLYDGNWRHKRVEYEISKITEKSSKAKKSAESRWEFGKSGGVQMQSERNANAKRTVCYSESESDIDNTIMSEKAKKRFDSCFSFEQFWSLYSKKTGKAKTEIKYSTIKEKERILIKEKLPNYIKATPEVKFRKDPLTYLNGSHWEDEIIVKPKEDVYYE